MEPIAVNQANTYIIQSQEEEIKRISHDLHEGISQNLYSLYTGLEFLQSGIEDNTMKEYAKELSALMKRTIQEVRMLSVELYPNTLAELGIRAALDSYIKLFTSTFGIIIDVNTTGQEYILPETTALAVFRSCQEAMINIAKHADVTEAAFRFTWEEKSLTIDIVDTGKGFNVQKAMDRNLFKGIAAIKQRMHSEGGEALISSEEGKGSILSLILPIKR
ncbi:histidine kinase [Virgibacillus sp. C22-A2]|uniref:histidine kinase n=1 Tax=Virgibacillus tibetensis TaxID=3042313 RepID=A0ABU6KJL4_9BACI|nr:histidine kinase [Virgibacillus sp. C22-A2]